MKKVINENSWIFTTPIAHRGLFDDNYPENTAPAFEQAILNGYAIETDVHMSSDGVLFCFHDNTALRVCGVDKDVRDMTFEEVKTLRAINTDYGVLSFDEFLALVDGKVPIMIEVKDQGKRKGICEKLVERLKTYNGEFAIQSFNPILVRKIQKFEPKYTYGVLTTSNIAPNIPNIIKYAIRHYWYKNLFRIDFFNQNIADLESDAKYVKNYPVICFTARTNVDVKIAEKYALNVIFEKTAGDLGKFKKQN
jgi:glycerophosphoryl diester phosphodiesterase